MAKHEKPKDTAASEAVTPGPIVVPAAPVVVPLTIPIVAPANAEPAVCSHGRKICPLPH